MGAQKTVGIAAAIALLLTIDPVVAATPKAKTPPKETQPVAAVPVPRPRPTPPAIARSAPAPSARAALRIDDEVLDSVERLSLLPPGAVVKPAAPVDEEPVAAAVAAINPIKAAVAAPAVAAIKAPPRPAAAPPGEAAPPPASLMGGPLRPLTAEQRALALRALALIEGGQADKGGALADQLRGQTALVSYLDYERLRRSGSGASFGEITEFVRTHRDWPRQEMLQRRAEEAITGSEPADRLMAWFAENPPVTGIGMVRYGELLAARGGDAQPWLRRAWIEGTFSPQEEAAFLGRNGSHLAAIDHYRRADRLLWESNVAADAVRRLLPMLDDGHRALVEARLAFRLGTKNPEGLVARVPQKLVGDPGLAYERIRARERQGRDDDSDIALSGPPADPAQGDKFWALRQAQARKALADGRVAAAYRYAANHGALSGGSLAEAEFLAGWIALAAERKSPSGHPAFREAERGGEVSDFEGARRLLARPLARGRARSRRRAALVSRSRRASDDLLRPVGPGQARPAQRPRPAGRAQILAGRARKVQSPRVGRGRPPARRARPGGPSAPVPAAAAGDFGDPGRTRPDRPARPGNRPRRPGTGRGQARPPGRLSRHRCVLPDHRRLVEGRFRPRSRRGDGSGPAGERVQRRRRVAGRRAWPDAADAGNRQGSIAETETSATPPTS